MEILRQGVDNLISSGKLKNNKQPHGCSPKREYVTCRDRDRKVPSAFFQRVRPFGERAAEAEPYDHPGAVGPTPCASKPDRNLPVTMEGALLDAAERPRGQTLRQ